MILNCVVIDDDPEALNQITSHIKRTPPYNLLVLIPVRGRL